MGIDELGKRVLRKFRREKGNGSEGRVSRGHLKEGEGGDEGTMKKRRIEERIDDGPRMGNRRDEGGRAM